MNRYVMSVAVLAVTGSVCAQAVQWTEAEGGNGHWYAVIDGANETWFEHRDRALAMGGDLACVANESANEFIHDVQIGSGYCGVYVSLGGMQVQGKDEPAGGWYWVSGEPWSYTNWAPSEPNDQGGEWVLIFTDTASECLGFWNDVKPHESYTTAAMAIEWSADCNGDGIVDYGQILDGTYADDDGNGVPDCCDMGIPCATEWALEDGGNGHWYEEVLEPGISWGNASDSCISVGGHLATVTSAEENLFIAGISNANEQGDYGIWLGGFQDETSPDYSEPGGGWTWVTNEPWSYESWNQNDCHPSNQPDNANQAESVLDYFCGSADALYWSDDGPEWPDSSGYLIEWSADCNGDDIVDYGQILDGSLEDLNENGVPDCCDEGAPCFGPDCNGNDVPDDEDIANGFSQDCNTNDIPDECDLADGTSSDCNVNSIPDECESLADCDGDGTSDACEILDGALDVNPADGVPDECQGLPAGACCVNGTCMMGTAANCFAAEGSYAGDGVSCIDANCPPVCLGDLVPDGVVDINDVLVILSEFGSVCP
jgi:hypothetical protein